MMLQASQDDQRGPPLRQSNSVCIPKPRELQEPHFLIEHFISYESAAVHSEMLASSNGLLHLTMHFESYL